MNSNTITSRRNRGLAAWLIALVLVGYYVILYWDSNLDSSRFMKEALATLSDSKQRQLIKASLIEKPAGEFVTWKYTKNGQPVVDELTEESRQLVEQIRSEQSVIFQRLNWQVYRLVDPLSYAMHGKKADKWFLYGTLYTLLILVYGFKFIKTWRNNRYQRLRTLSVMTVQLLLAFILPALLEVVAGNNFYLSYFWPLKIEYLFPEKLAGLPVALALWAVMMSFVAVPVLTYYFGKRWYCSWVCGCGALANTFGDQWRHLSSKSRRAWRIEKVSIYSVLALAVVTTLIVMVDFFRGGNGDSFNLFARDVKDAYFFFITAGFAGVVGTGFYPLAGTRIWCRFGCPQAAILGILQVFFSRFRITVNGDQCMECGNCSTYCEMGIDVRSYAMNSQSFARASCVGCGMCSAVCPRGVLKLESSSDGRKSVKAEF